MKIGLLFAAITGLLGLIVQKVLPIFFPSAFNNGLIIKLKDPWIFYDLAVKHAKWLRHDGLEAFDLWPNNQFPAGVLGFVMFLFDFDSPLLQIPLNAIFVGLTAVVMLGQLESWEIPKRWAYVIITLLLFTPTSISWSTQISKDVYIVFGVVCLFRALSLEKDESSEPSSLPFTHWH